jgi:hypothetical protein
MKRTIFVLLSAMALAVTTGCLHRQARHGGCASEGCAVEGCAVEPSCAAVAPAQPQCEQACEDPQPAPPQVGTVAYPYYNLRGPRDFLDRNPRSIGP